MTGGGDHPDFWEPEDEGEVLQGVVTARRDNPWAEEEEQNPKQIINVQTHDKEWATKTHTALSNLIQDQNVEVGDYVRIEFTGTETTSRGQTAYVYRIGVVKEEELEESGIDVPETDGGVQTLRTALTVEDMTVSEIEDEVSDIEDVSKLEDAINREERHDNRSTAKEALRARVDELSAVPQEAIDFTEHLVEFNGAMEREELERYLTEVRDFDVSPEDVVAETELELRNDVIR